MTAISAQTVANQFITIAKERGQDLTPMQVLKLVYLAHGWELGYTGNPLINNRIEAWKYGPVIPSLYEEVRKYGAFPISDFLPQRPGETLSNSQTALVERVYNTYEGMNGVQLSALTHQKDTPWDMIYNQGMGDWAQIPDSVTKEFYRKRVEANSVGE